MKMTVRAFNDAGIARFRAYLEELRSNGELLVPFDFLEDSSLTHSVDGFAEVDPDVGFASRLEAGKYFCESLVGISEAEQEKAELWAWISLAYFDQVCPVSSSGKRKPGRIYGYIPSTRYTEYYRHKLLGPYNLYKLHGEYASALLSNPVHVVGEINEQMASRQTIVSNKEMMKAIHQLYYDAERATFKRGATTRKKGGSVDRFWRVKEQLDMTYDFFSMTCKQILSILPSEFNSWWMNAEPA